MLVGTLQQVSSCQRGDLCAFAHHREEAGFWYPVIVEIRASLALQVGVELLKLEEASFRGCWGDEDPPSMTRRSSWQNGSAYPRSDKKRCSSRRSNAVREDSRSPEMQLRAVDFFTRRFKTS